MKKRALISVFDKTGIVEIGKELEKLGYEIVSTGSTAATMQKAGIKVTGISEITGFPECLDGRVKTLHPAVHAGILAIRNNASHMEQLQQLNVDTIDIVISNLYPFKQTISKPNTEFSEAVENIDIGGPTMVRSAAKNYQDVLILTDPSDYAEIVEKLKTNKIDLGVRKTLMYKAFQHTSTYDTLVANYLKDQLNIQFPNSLTLAFELKEQLRYGENPHQNAAIYQNALPLSNSLLSATQLGGKQLSYNNINDANGAVELLKEFDGPTAVAVKHANPCGVACGTNIFDAYKKAHDSDPLSVFGGIVAVNGKVEAETATEMIKTFLEIVIAPDFSSEALEILKTKENLRILVNPEISCKNPKKELKYIYGGLLVQDSDITVIDKLVTVTKKKPTEQQKEDMIFGMKVVKHCKSNAIVVVKNKMTLGLGIGQTNRIWPTMHAISHSKKEAKDAILASDAFFPFSDCVEEAKKAEIAAIIQPGGAKGDQLSIDLCDKSGIAMCFSGFRHFKH